MEDMSKCLRGTGQTVHFFRFLQPFVAQGRAEDRTDDGQLTTPRARYDEQLPAGMRVRLYALAGGETLLGGSGSTTMAAPTPLLEGAALRVGLPARVRRRRVLPRPRRDAGCRSPIPCRWTSASPIRRCTTTCRCWPAPGPTPPTAAAEASCGACMVVRPAQAAGRRGGPGSASPYGLGGSGFSTAWATGRQSVYSLNESPRSPVRPTGRDGHSLQSPPW